MATITLFACSSNSDSGGNNAGGITIGDGGDFNPVGDKSPVEPGDEACENTDTVSISPPKIAFGLNELEAMECQTISVNACLTFSAEIDDSSSPEFVLTNAGGTEVPGRLTNQQEGVQVCYKRTSEGTHSGKVNVVVAGASATYASVIPLSGTTVGYMFLNFTPKDGQLVWEKAPEVTAYDGANFTIPAGGTVNMTELSSIITSDEITIGINGVGSPQTLSYGSNGSFSTSINIPTVPAVYPVSFSIETTKGILTKTIGVIRYAAPSGSIEVRDSAGALVSAVGEDEASATDSSVLKAGIYVENLDVSGPSIVKSDGTTDEINPVTISLSIQKSPQSGGKTIYWDKEEWVSNNEDIELVNFYNNFNGYVDANEYESYEDCKGEIFSEPAFTFCIPLPPTADLGKGTNTLIAQVCNDYKPNDGDTGCVTLTSTIVVSNDVPIITITSETADAVQENGVYDESKTLKLTGSIQNYEDKQVTINEDGSTTETCLVKLWLNTSEGQTAIDLCNELAKNIESNEDGAESGGNQGNIRKATFDITLNNLAYTTETLTGTESPDNHKLTLYTNLVFIKAQNARSHVAYKALSFQRGDLNKSTVNRTSNGGRFSLTGDLTTGQLGEISLADGSTERAPLMLNISEGTLQEAKIIAVLEKVLNDSLKLKDLIQGYVPNEDGEIESDPDKPGYVEANAHLGGLARVLAWIQNDNDGDDEGRDNLNPANTNNACGYHNDGTCAAVLFIKNLDDERLFGSNINKEPFWSPVVFGKRNEEGELLDTDGDVIQTKNNGWPEDDDDIDHIAPDYDYDDVEQGKITVDDIEFNSDGSLDAQITIHGFKGHAVAFPVCEYGAMKFPTAIPIIFNMDKLRLHLENIQIKKIQLKPDGTEYQTSEYYYDLNGNRLYLIPENRSCAGSGSCTNKLIIDYNDIKITDVADGDGNDSNDSIYITPSTDCADREIGAKSSTEPYLEPNGCNVDDEGFDPYYWMLIEARNDTMYLNGSPGLSLVVILQQVLRNTFKDMLSCDIPADMVNPLFDSNAFPYHYTPESQRISDFTMALDDTDDGVAFAFLEDAKNPVFTFAPNLKEADILIQDGGLSLKLPLSMGASGVSTIQLRPKGNSSSVTTRRDGYMYRDFSATSSYSYPPAEVANSPYLGLSLGIEEFIHAATHVLWKKGIKSVLDLIDPDLAADLEMSNNWTVGIDKVVLGRLGICDQVAIMKADLPPAQLFGSIEEFFSGSGAIHLDISLDKNQPPTLAILPVEGQDNTVTVQVGLSNVQVDVKNLDKAGDPGCVGKAGTYCVGSSVVKLRLDLMLKLIVSYNAASRELEVYILPLDQTPIYISVINRGDIYDDSAIVRSLRDSVLPSTWENFKAAYEPDGESNKSSLGFILPTHAAGFGNSMTVTSDNMGEAEGFDGLVIVNNTTSSQVGECTEGDEPQYARRFNFGDMTPKRNPHPFPPGWGDDDGDDDGDGGDDQEDPPAIDLSNIEIQPLNDPCMIFQSPIADNTIKGMLCDYGIKDVEFRNGPDIQFDYENGYIHLSTELIVNIYKWLEEEVSTE